MQRKRNIWLVFPLGIVLALILFLLAPFFLEPHSGRKPEPPASTEHPRAKQRQTCEQLLSEETLGMCHLGEEPISILDEMRSPCCWCDKEGQCMAREDADPLWCTLTP